MKNEPPGVPAARTPIARPIEVIIVVVGLMLLIGQYVNFQQNQDIQQTQSEGKVRTFQTRAITCDLSKGIGVIEPEGCSTPEVVEWRDPKVLFASSASSRASGELKAVICSVLMRSDTIVLPPGLCQPTG